MPQRKRISVALFCFVFSFAALLSQNRLTVPEVSANPEGQVIVPVQINAGSEVSALQFSLVYDPDVLAPISEAPVVRGEALDDHGLSWRNEPGRLTIFILSPKLRPLKGGHTLLSLLFEVSPQGAAAGPTPITIEEVSAASPLGANLGLVADPSQIVFDGLFNRVSADENQLVFPQIANGTFPGGTIVTLLILVNRTGAPAGARVDFYQSDGSPFVLGLTDGRMDSQFEIQIPAGASLSLATAGTGDAQAGYARVYSTAPLGGVLIFSTLDGSGTTVAEVGVAASPRGRKVSIPVTFGNGLSTGVALANLSAAKSNFTLKLKDETGATVEEQELMLDPGNHLPRFVDQLFMMIGAQFRGIVEIEADREFSAVALRTVGPLLTTLPTVPLERNP